MSTAMDRARRKFRRFFPRAFKDPLYLNWERDYKWEAVVRWEAALGQQEFQQLLHDRAYTEVATRALRVEQQSRHSMIFSFEKMALRDAVRSDNGAKAFAEGLFDFLHGSDALPLRFDRWVGVVDHLPRRQTRVLTWPNVTVFGFIGQPREHLLVKPNVTRRAAAACGYPLQYASRPSWTIYEDILGFAAELRRALSDWTPRDMIDVQSFMWVQGSDEYD